MRVGKGKVPFALERLQTASGLLFVERALTASLAPNRDVGVQVLGDVHGGVISYAGAVMNGVADGSSGDADSNDGKDVIGRIVVRPFGAPSAAPLSGLLVGIAGTTGTQQGPLATIRTSSQLQSIVTFPGATADGRVSRYSPQASYFFRRAAALAEYVHTEVPVRKGAILQDVSSEAWQIAGSYVLTKGDTATDRGVRPLHNFDFGHGHLGALQVAARYHALSVDPPALASGVAAPGSSLDARGWTGGLNWYLSANVKYVVNVERLTFGADHAEHEVGRLDETTVTLRAQVYF